MNSQHLYNRWLGQQALILISTHCLGTCVCIAVAALNFSRGGRKGVHGLLACRAASVFKACANICKQVPYVIACSLIIEALQIPLFVHSSFCMVLSTCNAFMLSILAFLALIPSLSSATMAPRRAIRKAPSSKSRASGTKPSKFKPFPPPKKGVQRMIHKRPAGEKDTHWVKTPYVQKKFAAATCRRDRKHWKRSVQQLLAADDKGIIHILIEDGFLPNMEGKTCPMCNKGVLGKSQLRASGLPRHRCNRKYCNRFVTPQHLHPLFTATRGSRRSFATSAIRGFADAALQCASEYSQHLDSAQLQSLGAYSGAAWSSFVKTWWRKKEKEIHFGRKGCWQDVEAD